MFRVIVLCVLFAEIMQAGWLDFWHATQAKQAYVKGDYAKAASLYQQLDASHDAVLYDLGNSYYKQKEYDKAIKTYEKVQEPALMPQALHNTGNAYAMLHQNDQAIKAYETALKLKEDADTRFNLELLKKNQEKEKKQQNNQQTSPSSKEDNNNQQNASNQSDDANRSKENATSNPSSQNPSEQKQAQETRPKDAPANPSQKEDKAQSNPMKDANTSKAKEDKAIDQKTAQATQEEEVKAPISEQEERQWDKILDQKSVNTLMLPLSPKGEQNANTKPW